MSEIKDITIEDFEKIKRENTAEEEYASPDDGESVDKELRFGLPLKFSTVDNWYKDNFELEVEGSEVVLVIKNLNFILKDKEFISLYPFRDQSLDAGKFSTVPRVTKVIFKNCSFPKYETIDNKWFDTYFKKAKKIKILFEKCEFDLNGISEKFNNSFCS